MIPTRPAALLLSAVLLCAGSAAADTIYRCGTVYQNYPCPPGTRGGRVELPPVAIIGGVRTITPQQEPRARFSSPERRTVQPPLPDRSIENLAADARRLRSEVSRLRDEVGIEAARMQVERLRTRVNAECVLPTAARDPALRAACERATRDVIIALGRLPAPGSGV